MRNTAVVISSGQAPLLTALPAPLPPLPLPKVQGIKGTPGAQWALECRILPRGDMATERTPLSTQSMRLLASDLQRMDIAQLDPEALGNIKKLSVSLVTLRLLSSAVHWIVFPPGLHT